MSLFRFLFSASKTAKRFWNLSFWHFKSSRSFLFSFCVESSWLEVFWTFLPHSSNFVRMFTITSVCLSTNSFNSLQTTLIQHSFQQQFCDSYSNKCKIFKLQNVFNEVVSTPFLISWFCLSTTNCSDNIGSSFFSKEGNEGREGNFGPGLDSTSPLNWINSSASNRATSEKLIQQCQFISVLILFQFNEELRYCCNELIITTKQS